MEHYRYGDFRISDYWVSLVAIVILMVFSTTSVILQLPIWFIIVPTIYAVIWMWVILTTTSERFELGDDSIVVSKGRKKYTIVLPTELTLVISYADICPPLAKRTAFGRETHVLKDRYAVSVLRKMPLEITLETLHRNYLPIYTTSTIQTVFDEYHYLYGFVCNQLLLTRLIGDRKCFLIIPESLSGVMDVNWGHAQVCIDKGY